VKILFKRENAIIEFKSISEAARETKISIPTIERLIEKKKTRYDNIAEVIGADYPHSRDREVDVAISSLVARRRGINKENLTDLEIEQK
jgi:hypothetical protein